MREKLEQLEAERNSLALKREAIEQEPTRNHVLPDIDELKQLARVAMARQCAEPYGFGRLMHELIFRIVVWPFRLCDSRRILLKAEFTLSLTPLLPMTQRVVGLDQILRRDLVVELFDPPQREAYRKQIVELRAEGVTKKAIAQQQGPHAYSGPARRVAKDVAQQLRSRQEQQQVKDLNQSEPSNSQHRCGADGTTQRNKPE